MEIYFSQELAHLLGSPLMFLGETNQCWLVSSFIDNGILDLAVSGKLFSAEVVGIVTE